MTTVNFDANGAKLWVRIDTLGLYAISYTYTLLASDDAPATDPGVLIEPIVQGDNSDGVGKYYYPVVNDFKPGEPLVNYDGRYILVYFFVKKISDDSGFQLNVTLLQGDDAMTAVRLGNVSNDPSKNTVGDANSYAELRIEFEIKKL